jgi:hypothetical protein
MSQLGLSRPLAGRPGFHTCWPAVTAWPPGAAGAAKPSYCQFLNHKHINYHFALPNCHYEIFYQSK